MGLAVVFTVLGLIAVIIAVGVDPLSSSSLKENIHPILGLICIICAFIQPIMALLRPTPNAP
jgi:hypothetical protein